MEAMDADRLRLYGLLKPKLDEEAAQALVVALGPQPDRVVTTGYLDKRLSELTDKLTWRMITVVGAWTVVATSLFAYVSRLFG